MKALSLWHGVIEVPELCDMAEICRQVADEWGVTPEDLKGPAQRRAVSWPRHHAMWAIRRRLGYSLPRIGRFFGDRDHTTVLHAVRAHEGRHSHLLSDINTSSTPLNPPNPAGVALVP